MRPPYVWKSTPKPTYTLAWGSGGRLKVPPVPFGYFRAVESNRKTRACQGGHMKLRRRNQEIHNPSGSFGPTSLCTREALVGCLCTNDPKNKIDPRRTCRRGSTPQKRRLAQLARRRTRSYCAASSCLRAASLFSSFFRLLLNRSSAPKNHDFLGTPQI